LPRSRPVLWKVQKKRKLRSWAHKEKGTPKPLKDLKTQYSKKMSNRRRIYEGRKRFLKEGPERKKMSKERRFDPFNTIKSEMQGRQAKPVSMLKKNRTKRQSGNKKKTQTERKNDTGEVEIVHRRSGVEIGEIDGSTATHR